MNLGDMNFRQSAVTSLSREQVIEEWHKMPDDIQPVYLGSGEITLSVDATGMQGLNTRVTNFRETAAMESPDYPIERNLHLYRDEALSTHYNNEAGLNPSRPEKSFTVMPFGWVEYDLILDGVLYGPHEILKNACAWRRIFRPRDGIVETSFTMGMVKFKWTSGLRRDSVEADFAFTAEAQDYRSHSVELILKCQHQLRDGRAIYTAGLRSVKQSGFVYRSWKASDKTSTAKVKNPIHVSWAWASSETSETGAEENSIWLHWKGDGRKLGAGFRLVFGSDRDDTESEDFARTRARNLREEGVQAGLASITHSWNAFFKNAADIQIGHQEKEYLMALSQYVLRAGGDWHSGLPLGTLWTRKFNGGTFWDSFYAADGMLRCGHTGLVREFCDWLIRTAAPKGRPHMWITWHDGEPATDPDSDKAYINCLAYAGICIRLYETTRSEDDLKSRVWPYLEAVCTYLAEEIFEFTADRKWELKGIVAGDVGIESLNAKEQNDTLMWAVLCMGKYAEYAHTLKVKDKLTRTAAQIAEYFQKNPVKLKKTDLWYAWFPYLCPAGPYADFSTWWDGTDMRLVKKFMVMPGPEKHIFDEPEVCLNPLLGTYAGMAWGNFCTSASFSIVGLPDLALEFQDGGLKHISGIGYFTECGYETNAGGNSPYIPSSGSFLSCLSLQFVSGSLWNDVVDIALNFPHLWRGQKISWQNIRSINGARVSGVYEPTSIRTTVECERQMKARVRVPYRIAGEPINISLNGRRVRLDMDEKETILIDLPVGQNTIQIEADLKRSHDVILIECMDQGIKLKKLLEKADCSVRWFRNPDRIRELDKEGQLIVMNVSFVRPAGELSDYILREVQAGANLLLFYHGGVLKRSGDLAVASGVNGDYTDEWNFKGDLIECEYTKSGKRFFDAVESDFSFYRSQAITTSPDADTEVLAYQKGTKNAVLTRKRYGKGMIYWVASGGTFMDRPETVGWGLHFVREYFVYGRTRESLASFKWLENDSLMDIVVKITKECLKR